LRRNLAFVLNDLGPSQLAFSLISRANERCRVEPLYSFLLFYEDITRPCVTPLFPIMPSAEMVGFRGTLVGTSLATLEKARRVIGARPALYLNDLEWTRPWVRKDWGHLSSVYCDERIKLFARSEDHAELFDRCWGRRPAVVPPEEIT
jgi:hypothetical protein